jgi:hypothetical protein
VYRTYLVLLPDISGETEHIRSKFYRVRWTFLAAMFDDCSEHNLLTVSLMDPILLLLAS